MYQHILIAVDGSDDSHQAVRAAIEIAKKFLGDVLVLHVHEHELGKRAAGTRWRHRRTATGWCRTWSRRSMTPV